jgi:hypothetical protein
MILHFNCPKTGKSFETADYSISDNRGIITRENGEKFLDATVIINSPCPYCRNPGKREKKDWSVYSYQDEGDKCHGGICNHIFSKYTS